MVRDIKQRKFSASKFEYATTNISRHVKITACALELLHVRSNYCTCAGITACALELLVNSVDKIILLPMDGITQPIVCFQNGPPSSTPQSQLLPRHSYSLGTATPQAQLLPRHSYSPGTATPQTQLLPRHSYSPGTATPQTQLLPRHSYSLGTATP